MIRRLTTWLIVNCAQAVLVARWAITVAMRGEESNDTDGKLFVYTDDSITIRVRQRFNLVAYAMWFYIEIAVPQGEESVSVFSGSWTMGVEASIFRRGGWVRHLFDLDGQARRELKNENRANFERI